MPMRVRLMLSTSTLPSLTNTRAERNDPRPRSGRQASTAASNQQRMKTITLHLTDLLFERAYIIGKERGFASLDEYLFSAVEDAILNDWYDWVQAEEVSEKILVEDDGGGMRIADDLDDDIPF